MSEVHATASSSAPAGWIDLRERDASGRIKTAKRGILSGLDVDASVAFALFLIMLFIPQLDTAGAALFVFISVGYALWRRKELAAILLPRALLLVFPALAVLSTVWSDEPLLTFKYSLEFALTIVVALILSAAPRPKQVIEGIFFAFAVHICASLVFGQTVFFGANGDTAFAGLNSGKNLLADNAATGFLASLGVFFIGIEDKKPSRCLVALLVAAAQIYTILIARSAGAIVGATIAAAIFLCLIVLRSTTVSVRATALAIGAFCLSFAAFAYETLSDIVVDMATRYFDKDMTFTGRIYLWQRAADLIYERPLLGRGYHAFWFQGNPDAEGLWRYLDIRNEYGFNFHNTFVELLVHLGWLGTIVCAICALVMLAFLVVRFIRRPNLAVCLWLGIIAYQIVRMPIETVIPGEFSVSSMLIAMALGLTLGKTPGRAPPRYKATVIRPR